MTQHEVKQFKLTSGEEIVCQVLEWPDPDDPDDNELVIRQPLKIVAYEPTVGGPRLYLFRPWMVLQAGEDQFQTLSDYQIVGEGNPTRRMLEQYVVACKHEMESHEPEPDVPETEDVIDLGGDSDDDPKIVRFPAGRTVH